MSSRRKILFVAMQDSIHVARWVDMIADHGWDLHFFPIHGNEPNPNLRGVTLHWPSPPAPPDSTVTVLPPPSASRHPPSLGERAIRFARLALQDPREAGRRLRHRQEPTGSARRRRVYHKEPGPAAAASASPELPARRVSFHPTLEEVGGPEALAAGSVRLGETENAAPVLNGPGVLASLVRRLQPDLIHSMEYQHAGYLVLRARELYGPGFPLWLATNWGSDIYYYQRFDDHRAQIKRLLASIDFYSCECSRDIGIARSLGYKGKVLPVLPNSGGFRLNKLAPLRSPEPPSQRKLIMVKGYDHFAGRAMVALQLLEHMRERLKGYQIVMFSVSAEPRKRALWLKEKGILDIKVIDWATHEDILSHVGRARISLAVSISDGISTSSLEAMAMGAFPIQTNTSCCDEWFRDGEGGFIIPPDDFDVICDRFQRALEDDALVDRAAKINAETVSARLDRNVILPKVRAFYDEVFASELLAQRTSTQWRR